MGAGQDSTVAPYEMLFTRSNSNSITCYSCNRTGAYHIEKGTPSQDACYTEVAEDSTVFCAVADGHGDAKHDLSEFGASLAVRAGVTVMKSIYQSCEKLTVSLYRSFRDDLPRLVLREWKRLVREDAKERGIPLEETGSGLFSRYGTTLLLAMVTEDNILIGQLGDGEILYINHDDVQAVYVDRDNELVGNVTYSLSTAQSLYHWHISRLEVPKQQGFLFLTTDGLSNCFADDIGFHTFAKNLFNLVQEQGVSELAPQIPTFLDEYSEKGSRDDISVSFIYFKGNDGNTEWEEPRHADYEATSNN